ncbi:hypothetical protein CL617_00900 [archaeon]|nr:hypothetical protein [archaeon]|tara:strand:- start:2689 stop:3249 length:561 start_codon:yes stop_codon:yes gene_type:complete
MPTDIASLFYQLQGIGFYEFILPFLLVFTITFAILEKVKIFGERDSKPRTNINAVVALIIGLFFVNNFIIISRLNYFLPKISLFIIVLVMTLVLFGILGANVNKGLGPIGFLVGAVISIIFIYWSLAPTLDLEFLVPYWVQIYWPTLLVAAIILIIIFAVVGGGRQSGSLGDTAEKWEKLIFGNRD